CAPPRPKCAPTSASPAARHGPTSAAAGAEVAGGLAGGATEEGGEVRQTAAPYLAGDDLQLVAAVDEQRLGGAHARAIDLPAEVRPGRPQVAPPRTRPHAEGAR